MFGQCVIFDAHLRHATMPWVGHCADGDLASLERPLFVAPAVPVVFELFSGSGRVTAYLRKLGLQAAHGIDHVVVPEAASSTLIADPTTEEGPQLASFWITNPPLSAEFAAPPCGPHSRAFACENPSRSWFWNTSFFPGIAHLCPARVTFDHCAFGGHRPKRTTIASSLDCFSSVSKSCTRLTHTCRGMCPPDGFATKADAAYPSPLANEIATAIARHLVSCDWRPPGALPLPSTLLAACRAMANDQPEASKFSVRVPEHCAVILVRGSSQSWQIFRVHPWRASRRHGPSRRIALAPAAPSLRMLSCSEQLHYRLTGVLLPVPMVYYSPCLGTPALRMPKSSSWPGVLLPMPRISRFEDAQVVELAWGVPHSPEVFRGSCSESRTP